MAEAEYIFDPAWEQERERIGSGEKLFDPFTQQVLETIGIDDGWECLEIGAGGGTIASWMCEQVAPSGEVVAIDLDTRFVERMSHPNLEVRQHDITTGPVDDRTHLVEILSGVQASENVIATKFDNLQHGQPARLKSDGGARTVEQNDVKSPG